MKRFNLEYQKKIFSSITSCRGYIRASVNCHLDSFEAIGLNKKNGDNFEPSILELMKYIFSNDTLDDTCDLTLSMINLYPIFAKMADEKKLLFWKDCFLQTESLQGNSGYNALLFLVENFIFPKDNRLDAFKMVVKKMNTLALGAENLLSRYQTVFNTLCERIKNFDEYERMEAVALIGLTTSEWQEKLASFKEFDLTFEEESDDDPFS